MHGLPHRSGFRLNLVLLGSKTFQYGIFKNELLTDHPPGSRVRDRVLGSSPSMFQEFLVHLKYLRNPFGNSSNIVYHRRDGFQI